MTSWVAPPSAGPTTAPIGRSTNEPKRSTSSVSTTSFTLSSSAIRSRYPSRRSRSGPATVKRAQREPDAQPLGVAQRQRARADLPHPVHVGHERVIGRQLVGIGPRAEVDAVAAGQAVVDLVGQQRQDRGRDPAERDQHRVQGVEGVVLGPDGLGIVVGGPEAAPAAADVPVVQGVEEGGDVLAGGGQVVAVERLADVDDQLAGLGQDVAVEPIGGVMVRRWPRSRRRWRTG